MFSGLIESVGFLEKMTRRSGGAVLHIGCKEWETPLVKGESVAVQGACLTVTTFDKSGFEADVLDETLRCTCLGRKREGQCLNLERALRIGDRLGGHFVSGHVDGTGYLDSVRMDGRDRVLRIRCGSNLAAAMIEKGSVALDGISLTLSSLDEDAFEVCVIPWTWSHTSLQERKAGDLLNVENDLVGKYIRRYLSKTNTGGITEQNLMAAGFMES